MNKNNKFLFLGLTLLLLLISVSAISATDDNMTTTLHEKTTTNNNVINVEKTIQTKDDIKSVNVKSENKNIKSMQKDLKTQKKVSNTTVNINSSNYNQYFKKDGQLQDNISANSSVILNGQFENKTFQINKPGIYFTGKNATIKNGQITITQKAENSTITNINIQISKSNITKAINNQAMGVTISNINITYNKPTGITLGILNTAENVSIINNNIKIEGPNAPIDWSNSSSERFMKVNTAAISCEGDNINIYGNNISVTIANNSTNDPYGTVDVIEIVSGDNVNILNNTIVASKASYVYAISAAITNSRVSNNKFNITSETYINAIQIGNMIATGSNVEIANNIITGVCKNMTPLSYDESKSYAIIASGVSKATNMNITNNTINIDATLNTGVELYNTENNTIAQNKMNLSGVYITGIKGNLALNTKIINNTINSNGNSKIPVYNGVYGTIYANNAVYLENSRNVNITNNNMKIMDKGCDENTKAVILNKSNTIKVAENIIDTTNDEDKTIQTSESSNIQINKNTIYINGTQPVTYIITNNTINQYFIKENGYMLSDIVSDHDTLNIQGTIADLNDPEFKMVINKQVKIISTTHDAIIRNIPIVITTDAEKTKIINITLELIKQTGEAIPIKSSADKIEIINNTIKVEGPNTPIDWTYYPKSYVNTAAISSEGDDIIIYGNNITVTKAPGSQDQAYGTIDAIEIITGNNVSIQDNIISASKGVYVYAVSATLNNSNISNNKFIINGETYINAIQLANPSFNVTITNNTITGVCKNTTTLTDTESISYAIISSSRTNPGNNITITDNTINIDATLNTGIEIYNTENSTINNNKINLKGAYTTAIKCENAANTNIKDNTINNKGNSQTTTIPDIYGAIYINNGINLKSSPNTNITTNNITVVDTGCSDQTAAVICTSSDNTQINGNILDTSNVEDKAIQTTTSENITTQRNAILVNGTRNANTYTITNDTINQYFNKENGYKLADTILIGDILNIQGTIADLNDPEFKMVINKPVTITSTTNNAIIRNIPITITHDATNTNISNLNIELESESITPIINNANNVTISNNTIKVTSINPVTLIMTEKNNTIFTIKDNIINVRVKATLNNRIPLINTPNATVMNNKINLTDLNNESILGDEAVLAANIISNTPESQFHTFINITQNTQLTYNKQSNITIKVEGIYHQNITGAMNITINGETYTVNKTQTIITIKPDTMKVDITINYADETGKYQSIKNYTQTLNVSRSTSANIQITVNKKIYAGETIILTAIVSDNNKLIKNGNLVFKLNSVTLKDANGNPLKVKVINGVAVLEYMIPANYSAKDYMLSAVFSNSEYDRTQANTVITITPKNVFIQPVKVVYDNGKLSLKIQIKDSITTNLIQENTKTSIKVNGKTIINKQVVKNGEITIDYNIKLSDGQKTITIITGPNAFYNTTRLNITIMVKNTKTKTAKTTQITNNTGELIAKV